MAEQALLTNILTLDVPNDTVSQFRQEFLGYQSLLKIQPLLSQRYLEAQAATMAEAVIEDLQQLRFSLPDRVALRKRGEEVQSVKVPVELRDQALGGLMDRLIRTDLHSALRSRLMELEQSSNLAVSTSAVLLRYSTVRHMVHNMLPAGRSVLYKTLDGDEIASIPVDNGTVTNSAITGLSDARYKDEDMDNLDRGELLVPYVEAARKFYLPKWISFDNDGRLLAGTVGEAEADIASMQRYLSILHTAIGLAPYVVADDEYQSKRYGILGQLVNQGRALAHYQVKEIIQTIQRRAVGHDLDRGLSLSLPYFNDQTLQVENYDFDIIPSGRVMFIPAFVVLAVRTQGAKVAQDTRLNPSTRRQILMELGTLEGTFLR